jgi:hypothetical protein
VRDPRAHQVEDVAGDPQLLVQGTDSGDGVVVDMGDEPRRRVERGVVSVVDSVEEAGREVGRRGGYPTGAPMVIETTTFRLADGVDDAAYLEFDEEVRTGFLYRQPGMARATTARGDDGEWIVVVMWASVDAADAALEAGTDDGTMQRFIQLVDGAERKRYSTFD